MKPKIRIKGFFKEWDYLPFSEIANRNSLTVPSSNLPSVEFEDINAGEGTLNKDISKKKCIKVGKYFKEGDVLFGKLRPYLKNILLANFTGIAVGDFWVLRPQKITPELLYFLVNSKGFMRIANISSGSKMPRADWDLVSSTEFVIPNDNDEQQDLGKYFQSLDDLIQGTSKKIESLKQIKTASLQAMFPQEGETTPRLRFKGFNEEWEVVELNNIGFMTAGGTPSTYNDSYWNGNINWLQSGAIQNRIIYQTSVSRKISEEGLLNSSAYLIKKDSVLIAITGATCSNIGYLTFESAANQSVISVEPTKNYDSKFLYQALLIERNQILSFKGGSAQSGVSLSNLKKLQIKCPSINEQVLIGNFFISLDKNIEFYHTKLEKLKQIKSACLDNMFV